MFIFQQWIYINSAVIYKNIYPPDKSKSFVYLSFIVVTVKSQNTNLSYVDTFLWTGGEKD